jgi:Asp-tRNA(Asn)/Glu-tRNA(Gln) amidotransferase A subunit family amidase
LMMPSTPTAAPGVETTGDPIFNSPWSFLGSPELTIPVAMDGNLPLGLQFVSLQIIDRCPIFEAATICESLMGFNKKPLLLT